MDMKNKNSIPSNARKWWHDPDPVISARQSGSAATTSITDNIGARLLTTLETPSLRHGGKATDNIGNAVTQLKT